MASASSPVLRTTLWSTRVLPELAWMLTPSAKVSRIRTPTTYRPLVPGVGHMPTFVCSIQTFCTSEPVPKLPSIPVSKLVSSR